METFALYLIKSTVWLTGFFLIYIAFLRNERFFVLNRIYLVSGILVSILFPLFTWHYTVIFPVTPTAEALEPQVIGATTVSEPFPIQNLLLYFYLTGALYLLFRLIKQTVSVWKVIRNSETHHFNSIKLIRTDRYPASFSFFSFVFVNPSIDETETNEIVNHEQEHIRQQHWMDLLLFEILRTMHWFNPISWLYGRLIRQNHEYLADEQALQRSSNPAIYRAALLNQMFGGPVISLANSFNYSLNKKRFNMMKQKIYSPIRKLKLLLVLPLIAGVFYAFATPEYKFVQAAGNPEVSNTQQTLKTVKGKVVKEDGTPLKGTSIVVSGSTLGTMPDGNGNFKLEVPDDSPIVFSYIGFETVKVKPDFDKEMVIRMKPAVISIEAVGNKPPNTEIGKAAKPIRTLVNGKEISPEVAKKNLSNKFNRNPLMVVIDGVVSPNTNLDNIDPETIESINVLKDESATTMYGEKGKNGVVLVTLKKDDPISQTFKLKSNSPLKFKYIDDLGNKPLIIIDGVIAKNQDINNIHPETIESISVLKDESSTKIYGDKGKNGVILINLKKGASASQNTPIDLKVTGYGENKKEGITLNSDSKIIIKGMNDSGNETKPLIVIDGVISENQNLDKLDPETIESITVIKDETSTKKYGEKGKNGVLEITLKKEKEVFVVVEEMPQFPGGFEALKAFVAANLKYPTVALENGIQGQVYASFVVAEDGSVTNAKIERGIDPSLDKEALRIVNNMPKWKPGEQRGMPVKVSFTMPISFKLPPEKTGNEKLH